MCDTLYTDPGQGVGDKKGQYNKPHGDYDDLLGQ